MRRHKLVTGKKQAQAMVEFAIALPILLLLLYGIIEAGRLLFIYSSIVTASRQAARYGAATGDGLTAGVPRYGDCAGIRAAAQRVDFMNSFDDNDIVIVRDTGPGSPTTPYCGGDPVTSTPATYTDSPFNATGTRYRLVVTIAGDYNPIVPRIVPFLARTAANGNAIEATSSRTILASVPIGMPAGGGGGGGTETSTIVINSDNPDPSAPGETVTVTFTVTGALGPPTGSVTVTGGGSNCSYTSMTNGTGSCTLTFNTIGPKTLFATYSGDATYATSTSAGEPHQVGNVTTTTITTSPNPSLPGGSVNVTVTVTGGSTPPSGDVTISGADSPCSIPLDASGTGSCNVVFNSGGSKTLTASYPGDSSHDPSTGTTTHNVLETSTTTITTDAPDPSNVSGSVTVGVTVTGGSSTPTGAVLIGGADSSCNIQLSGGAGSCSVVFNSAGTKTLTATYSGDSNHSGSTDTESHEVQTAPVVTTDLTITSHTPNPSAPGETVAVAVTITGGSTTPTGTVTITGADANCTITLSNGTGSCNVVFNTAGTRTITATYNGDSTHSTSVITATHQVFASNSTIITSHIPNPSTPGATVAVSVTVSGGASIPTGTVTITGADTSCTINLDASGTGTCGVVFNSTGTKTLTATYSGDSSHSSSVGTATHQVDATQSGLQLQVTANPPTYTAANEWIAFSYQVTNTGNVTLDGLAITASRATTSITCVSTSLAPGTSTTCSGSYQTSTADANATSFINTATASASDGATTVTSNTAIATVSTGTPICSAGQQTITANADAWVDEDNPGSNNNTPSLTVRSRNSRNARAYVTFTLPAVPAGCVVQSAVLNLYASSVESGRTIQALQVTSSWNESTITWNLQPGSTTVNAASTTSGSTAGLRSWTVTGIVLNMYSSGANFGFLIRDSSEGAGGNGLTQVYNGKDSSTNKPTLVITFGQAP